MSRFSEQAEALGLDPVLVARLTDVLTIERSVSALGENISTLPSTEKSSATLPLPHSSLRTDSPSR